MSPDGRCDDTISGWHHHFRDSTCMGMSIHWPIRFHKSGEILTPNWRLATLSSEASPPPPQKKISLEVLELEKGLERNGLKWSLIPQSPSFLQGNYLCHLETHCHPLFRWPLEVGNASPQKAFRPWQITDLAILCHWLWGNNQSLGCPGQGDRGGFDIAVPSENSVRNLVPAGWQTRHHSFKWWGQVEWLWLKVLQWRQKPNNYRAFISSPLMMLPVGMATYECSSYTAGFSLNWKKALCFAECCRRIIGENDLYFLLSRVGWRRLKEEYGRYGAEV